MKTKHMYELLDEIIRKYHPNMTGLLLKAKTNTLTDYERNVLLDAISSEFCSTGLGVDDEPNKRGLLLESLLDYFNRKKVETPEGE